MDLIFIKETENVHKFICFLFQKLSNAMLNSFLFKYRIETIYDGDKKKKYSMLINNYTHCIRDIDDIKKNNNRILKKKKTNKSNLMQSEINC